MERLVQYLDDVEDMYCVVAVSMERVRHILLLCTLAAASFIIPILAIVLALYRPPLALGAASIASVGMLYRAATLNCRDQRLLGSPR